MIQHDLPGAEIGNIFDTYVAKCYNIKLYQYRFGSEHDPLLLGIVHARYEKCNKKIFVARQRISMFTAEML